MAYIESTRPIVTTNIGRPDYSGEVWQAKIVKRLEVHEKETIKNFALCSSVIPSPFAWMVAPLAVGVPAFLIDVGTGLPMPFVIPAGFTFEIMLITSTFNQNQRILSFLDTFLVTEIYNDALSVYYENEIVGLDTAVLDPDGLVPHLISYGGINVGLAAMSGSAEVIGILHDLHTEVPTSKTIRCKWCGNTISTSLTTVRWTCTKCGELNLYFHRSNINERRKVNP